jgi:cell division protease FtsH
MSELQQRRAKLKEVSQVLKSEFFGLDTIIDKIINSIDAWYVFPSLISRPVIVNLWGMSGVGKSSVLRRLSTLLEFSNRYVEIQMDGTSGSFSHSSSTIASILRSSSLEEGEPGILFLDEIQRYRTLDEMGCDLKVERYQDVWQLLSDGHFAMDHTLFREVEELLHDQMWSEDQDDEDGDHTSLRDLVGPPKGKKNRFAMSPWEAIRLKRLLKLTEGIPEIMAWKPEKVKSVLEEMQRKQGSWEADYRKILIFIAGNLDEAFSGSRAADDCDTDADVYHDLTSKITVMDIKGALLRRFRAEQVARLGNNHVIYPSLSKHSYECLIEANCNKYVSEMTNLSGIQFQIDPSVFSEIYMNGVYPTQGTRPVFSSIHKIFSSALVAIAVWGIENNSTEIKLALDGANHKLIGEDVTTHLTFEVEVDLDVRTTRDKNSEDFNILVAVHEASHALVHAVLFQEAPKEVRINLATFKGGFMIPEDREFSNMDMELDKIATYLAGAAGEELVFGSRQRSTGCGSDIEQASFRAAKLVRELGFSSGWCKTDSPDGPGSGYNTDVMRTNPKIAEICDSAHDKALRILGNHEKLLQTLVKALLKNKVVTSQEFTTLVKGKIPIKAKPEAGYVEMWQDWIEISGVENEE